ncbi:6591_t:CDS:2 [Racocetra persica]|uniref:6591_t:CDS:1 n=1 Tax=Racocetra persica TaxID=160502 RepID=A0ACA9KNG9_9GLOM|nr:6591_t:CDS:2 [Racocetra persica]
MFTNRDSSFLHLYLVYMRDMKSFGGMRDSEFNASIANSSTVTDIKCKSNQLFKRRRSCRAENFCDKSWHMLDLQRSITESSLSQPES